LGVVDTPNTVPTEPNMDSYCALANTQALVGMAWDDSLLEGIQAPGAVRVLRPNEAATMDFSPTRLNIRLDEKGIVLEASCG
jgi:Peptidase inhibitor I78 family